ncbi:MAG TPA: DUF2975 domain-containing protein [Aliidongia sp.]|nr:DUF2975 domain-containing protein [Aliidongia sp.]
MGILLTMTSSLGQADRPIHRRIQARSRIFASVFTGLLWLVTAITALLVLATLFYTGHNVLVNAEGVDIILGAAPVVPANAVSLGQLATRLRIGSVFALIVQFGPAILVLANLRGLFRLYAAGTVFAWENSNHIKRIGRWLVAYAVAPFVSVQLLILADCAVDRTWFHMVEVQALVLGGILLVIAQVMEAGREIEQDRDGFV